MQKELFRSNNSSSRPRVHSFGNGAIQEYLEFFGVHEANRYLTALIDSLPWSQDSIQIAGKRILIPRLQCWMGDPGAIYAYSGLNLTHYKWSPDVLKIRDSVQKLNSVKLNSVLINYYRDGNDSVSWHADDEKELGSDPVIVSVSFGAERKFKIKPKDKSDKRRFNFNLSHGSVLIMTDKFQQDWLHQVPKEPKIIAPRINLTFRHII